MVRCVRTTVIVVVGIVTVVGIQIIQPRQKLSARVVV